MSLLRRLTRVADRNVVQQPAAPPPSRGDESAKIVANIASLAGERRYADAYEAVNRALEHAPADTALLFAKGSTLLDWGRFGESRQSYEEAERNGLRSVGLYRHLGWACFHGGDLDAAERYLRSAILAGPNDFDALFCLGVVLQARDAQDEAADVLAQAVALRPNDFQARLMLGNSQLAHGNSAAAESCYRNAASIDPSHPAAWVNLGSALRRQGKLIEALAAFERAYELESENGESDADVFLSLALGWTDVGRLDEARRVLEANLALRPSVQAHYNYALVLLESGDLQQGWAHHEFRWLLDDKPSERAPYEKPVWYGQDLAGRTLLIRAEQGFGDTIQFLRYAKSLKDRGARVLLKIPSELEKLCKNIPGVDEILPTYETPLDFDFYVHTLSLGAAFGTTLESIPSSVPYIAVDPERKSRWKARLGPFTELAVGLVWA